MRQHCDYDTGADICDETWQKQVHVLVWGRDKYRSLMVDCDGLCDSSRDWQGVRLPHNVKDKGEGTYPRV